MAARMRSLVGVARCMHSSCRRQAITEFKMPAMSPTMSQGKISSWKVSSHGMNCVGKIATVSERDRREQTQSQKYERASPDKALDSMM